MNTNKTSHLLSKWSLFCPLKPRDSHPLLFTAGIATFPLNTHSVSSPLGGPVCAKSGKRKSLKTVNQENFCLFVLRKRKFANLAKKFG